jgi:hypothetical protein
VAVLAGMTRDGVSCCGSRRVSSILEPALLGLAPWLRRPGIEVAASVCRDPPLRRGFLLGGAILLLDRVFQARVGA